MTIALRQIRLSFNSEYDIITLKNCRTVLKNRKELVLRRLV